jgi:hypothetical protein
MPADIPFNQSVADEFCKRISMGRSVYYVCKEGGMPHLSTVMKWRVSNPSFKGQLERAETQMRKKKGSSIIIKLFARPKDTLPLDDETTLKIADALEEIEQKSGISSLIQRFNILKIVLGSRGLFAAFLFLTGIGLSIAGDHIGDSSKPIFSSISAFAVTMSIILFKNKIQLVYTRIEQGLFTKLLLAVSLSCIIDGFYRHDMAGGPLLIGIGMISILIGILLPCFFSQSAVLPDINKENAEALGTPIRSKIAQYFRLVFATLFILAMAGAINFMSSVSDILQTCTAFAVNPTESIKACTQLVQGEQRHANPDQYPIIWLHLAHVHAGQDDRQEFESNSLPNLNRPWPSPILALYLGKTTVDDVYAKANLGNPGKLARQACEAHAYVGEWYLQNRDKESAKKAFKIASSFCGTGEISATIQGELKTLGP